MILQATAWGQLERASELVSSVVGDFTSVSMLADGFLGPIRGAKSGVWKAAVFLSLLSVQMVEVIQLR